MAFLSRLLLFVLIVVSFFIGSILFRHVALLNDDILIENGVIQTNTDELSQFSGNKNIFTRFLSGLSMALPSSNKQLFAVIVENHEDARKYHLGLENALMIQEFFVEGYISRFVALFSDDDIPDAVGPVRSIRTYFLDAFFPWTSVIFHIGGSPEALDRVENTDDFFHFNAIYLNNSSFIRASSIPAPHNLFIEKEGISLLLSSVDEDHLKNISLPLFPTGFAPAGSGATAIRVNFYNPVNNVAYNYNSKKNRYDRINGDIVSPAHPSNILFLEMNTETLQDHGRLSIQTVGKGALMLFRSGRVYFGEWHRKSISDSFVFTDLSGKNIPLASGQIWLTGVDNMNRIRWE